MEWRKPCGFKSLYSHQCERVGIGRQSRFRLWWEKSREGSNPFARTTTIKNPTKSGIFNLFYLVLKLSVAFQGPLRRLLTGPTNPILLTDVSISSLLIKANNSARV